jgi:hypothetical protein
MHGVLVDILGIGFKYVSTLLTHRSPEYLTVEYWPLYQNRFKKGRVTESGIGFSPSMSNGCKMYNVSVLLALYHKYSHIKKQTQLERYNQGR